MTFKWTNRSMLDSLLPAPEHDHAEYEGDCQHRDADNEYGVICRDSFDLEAPCWCAVHVDLVAARFATGYIEGQLRRTAAVHGHPLR